MASLLPRTFGSVGGRDVHLYRLESAQAAVELLTYGGIVRSAPGFTADHMSVYSLSAGGKRAIWERTDRLIAHALQPQ